MAIMMGDISRGGVFSIQESDGTALHSCSWPTPKDCARIQQSWRKKSFQVTLNFFSLSKTHKIALSRPSLVFPTMIGLFWRLRCCFVQG